MDAPKANRELRIGLIGYGEVGRIFARALVEYGLAWVGAYDILVRDAKRAPELRVRADRDGVELCESSAALLARVGIAISAVTASAAFDAAAEAARSLRPGTYFLDLNSASPATKQRCAKAIEAAGGNYVEAAVMTSVPPYGIRVPMLLGGREARALAETLGPLGFDLQVVAEEIGVASAIKMCRSVIIKGMEAIFIEALTTARRYAVERYVIESLRETFPGTDWEKQASYFFQRVARHGRRRAEEMREAATAVREAGLEPWMAAASAERQGWMARLAENGAFSGLGAEPGWRDYADAASRVRGNRADVADEDRRLPETAPSNR